MDETNNKSSGTIYHVSSEGVSIKDDTNSKSAKPGTFTLILVVQNNTLAYNLLLKQ